MRYFDWRYFHRSLTGGGWSARTEAIMLTKGRAFNPPRLSIGDHLIALNKKLRHLNVILDTRLSFDKHVVTKNVAASAVALSRIMPKISGPCQWKSRLLGSMVKSLLLYGTPPPFGQLPLAPQRKNLGHRRG
ncbi:uncharacterized protein LOC103309649 [Acyrthosiphon pisum]|uniref:Uncharacterized protein n=1 Tax=Acyrthosiphon pisum TaxID=7029 RepID=A0A8R2F9C5_ACYPI|nr:uncharacterized protein LOC103309649 [Acyrthosiphon pisum]|eukprot:XP_008183853.1 PREDICTED: uncharacterized protein LOC103309649 [Acyrthosiphon pisum]